MADQAEEAIKLVRTGPRALELPGKETMAGQGQPTVLALTAAAAAAVPERLETPEMALQGLAETAELVSLLQLPGVL
jgi:hypothetical protein